MTKVILVRHGQTLWNQIKKYQGFSDIPLNETGRQQAWKVAERLAREEIRAIYSSDLCRAVQTAEAIGQKHGLPVQQNPAFREMNFGLWEGLTYEEIMEKWGNELSAIYAQPEQGMVPEGETFLEVQERAWLGFIACVNQHPGQTIVIAAHGGSIRLLLCKIMGKSLKELWTLAQDSTGVSIVQWEAGEGRVILSNDTSHLST